MSGRIARNIATYKRALRLAYCPDGWQTRNEYDDILAVLNGRWVVGDWPKNNGRPREHHTHESKLAVRREWYARKKAAEA